jgi:hypothetical protein
MRLSRLAIVIAAAAAPAGALLFAPAGPAAAISQVTGTGSPTCNAGWTGSITFSPALKTVGTATSVEMGIKVTFTGCTGGTPVPTSGSYVAKGITAQAAGANACANWFAAPTSSPPFEVIHFSSANVDGDVSWLPSGTINQSNVGFTTMRIRTGSGNRLAIRLPNPPGTGTVTGSYAPTASLALRIGQLFPAVTTACNSTSGLSSLKIVPANPSSIVSTGTW